MYSKFEKKKMKPSKARKKIASLTGKLLQPCCLQDNGHQFYPHLLWFLGRNITTINKVVKEFHIHGDFVDENAPRMRKNGFEKLSVRHRDQIRTAVSQQSDSFTI